VRRFAWTVDGAQFDCGYTIASADVVQYSAWCTRPGTPAFLIEGEIAAVPASTFERRLEAAVTQQAGRSGA
jgi:hypothetical protein